MLPGRRTPEGALFVIQGPPPAGTPLVGGIAVSPLGVIYANSTGDTSGFDPSDLFQNNEQGIWRDPSDLPTTFQDNPGQTPVTAAGQPVRLALDKSQGLEIGPELVINGDFSNGTTGWSTDDAGVTISVVGGELEISSTVPYKGATQISGNVGVAGKFCELKASLRKGTAEAIKVVLWDASWNQIFVSSAVSSPTMTHFSAIVNIPTDSFAIQFEVESIGIAYVDNVSVTTLAGNHSVAPSAAARPQYEVTGLADWHNFDGVDDGFFTEFPVSLGSNCTVARANVGAAPTILTGQTIGTSYTDSTDNAGLVVVNRDLTLQETTDLTAWLTANGATT